MPANKGLQVMSARTFELSSHLISPVISRGFAAFSALAGAPVVLLIADSFLRDGRLTEDDDDDP